MSSFDEYYADRWRQKATLQKAKPQCPYCRKRKCGTVGPCISVADEPTLCTCPTPLNPSAIDECMRCRRPVYDLLARRYGWWALS